MEFDANATVDRCCGDCSEFCAANALQSGHSNCPALTPIDADLQRVVGAWDGLPMAIRKAILVLVGD